MYVDYYFSYQSSLHFVAGGHTWLVVILTALELKRQQWSRQLSGWKWLSKDPGLVTIGKIFYFFFMA